MKSTVEMAKLIDDSKTWDDLKMVLNEIGIGLQTFGMKYDELCEKYNLSTNKVQNALETTYSIKRAAFYAYRNGERNPSKVVVIKMGLAIGATVEEVNELLKLAKHKELYAKSKEDAVLIFAIRNKKVKNKEDLQTIDELLKSYKSKMRFYEIK